MIATDCRLAKLIGHDRVSALQRAAAKVCDATGDIITEIRIGAPDHQPRDRATVEIVLNDRIGHTEVSETLGHMTAVKLDYPEAEDIDDFENRAEADMEKLFWRALERRRSALLEHVAELDEILRQKPQPNFEPGQIAT